MGLGWGLAGVQSLGSSSAAQKHPRHGTIAWTHALYTQLGWEQKAHILAGGSETGNSRLTCSLEAVRQGTAGSHARWRQ
eukprot:1146305-Pelagomonas_calceolata.AAC.11